MIKRFALLTLATVAAGQTSNDAFQGAIQGIIEGHRLRNEINQSRAMEELMRAQAEAVRMQTEQLRAQNQALSQSAAFQQRLDRDLETAVTAVRSKYPDYEQYRVESVRLMPGFNGVTSPAFNLEQYIEGMYLIAKYASFSTGRQTTTGHFAWCCYHERAGISYAPEGHTNPLAPGNTA